jgi:spermidine synthase
LSRKWDVLDRHETSDGCFELRKRADDDFLICLDGRVLMNSRESRSEIVLGTAACAGLAEGARVLVGGLGMGLTLRAVVDALPADAHVTVAELHPIVAQWCRGPLAPLSADVLSDSRVELRIDDVADVIREAGHTPKRYDAIVMDLFEGPHARTDANRDPLYGRAAIARSWQALSPKGVLGVWAEARDAGYESRLSSQGFVVESRRPGRGGFRHWIVLGRRPAAKLEGPHIGNLNKAGG